MILTQTENLWFPEKETSINHLTNFQKGEIFENFVKNLFDQKTGRFVVIDCTSEYAGHFGSLAARLTYPDLKFIFKSRGKWPHRFAVECKWRKCFNEGYISWASEYQLNNYVQFQKSYNITVFIAIGVGGHPADPEKLFVTPLDMISKKIHLTQNDLIPFDRNKKRRFFYDSKQNLLF